jgi:AcrR family transcriptional regulator
MTHAERRESTRAALITAGRQLFAAHGYDAVATEQIVEAAGVTRGALYHHFDGKAGLFEAVFLEIEAAHGLGLIRAGLDAAAAAGQLKPLPTEDLANALLGALTESALAAARAPGKQAARKRAEAVLLALLDGLAH